MAYANRKTVDHIYCPALNKEVAYKTIYHDDPNNWYSNYYICSNCCENKCPFETCKCKYDNGKLTLRD